MSEIDTSKEDQTYQAPVNFFYMKECHYARPIAPTGEQGWCVVPADSPAKPAIDGLWEHGVDGLTKKVNLIAMRLWYEDFSPEFSVQIQLKPTDGFGALVEVGEIDLSSLSVDEARQKVRDLVNNHTSSIKA